MAGIILALAAAGGLAAAHVFLPEGSWAQVANGGEFAADAVALLLKDGWVVGVRHGASCLYYNCRKDNAGRRSCNKCDMSAALG